MAAITGIRDNANDVAIDAAMDAIEQLPEGTTEDEFVETINRSVQRAIPGQWGAESGKKAAAKAVSSIYEFYRIKDTSVFGKARKAGPFTFGGPDRRSIRFMSRLDNFFFTGYVDNSTFQEPFLKFLREQYFERGAGIFGRGGDEQRNAFKQLFGGKLDALGNAEIDRIIDTSVARMRNWAQLEQLNEAKIKYARIVAILDAHTSEICRFLNGRVISVGDAVAANRKLASLEPGQFAESFYKSAEGNAYSADRVGYIRSRGLGAVVKEGRGAPPFHARCRSDLVYFYQKLTDGPGRSTGDRANDAAGQRMEELDELSAYELGKQAETMRLAQWSGRNMERQFKRHGKQVGYRASEKDKFFEGSRKILQESKSIVTFIHRDKDGTEDRQWLFYAADGKAAVSVSESTGRIVNYYPRDGFVLRPQDVQVTYDVQE